MIDFIVKYWVQELFGLLIIIGTFIAKKAWKQYTTARQMIQDEKDRKREERIYDKLDERFDDIVNRLNTLEEHDEKQDIEAEKRKKGILALYKKQFLGMGKELLTPGHIITYEEYCEYNTAHKLYNDLGGNHEGDQQFKLVTTKYESGLNNTK